MQIEVACLSHSPGMTRVPVEGHTFRAAGDQVADAVAKFAPTLVVFFGPDHQRAITDLKPCFTVVESAEGFGDWKTTTDAYDVPRDLARDLAGYLADHDIDIALATKLRIDHAFAMPMCQLFGRIDSVKVLPIVINCIGTPIGPMRRSALLGQTVGDFLRATQPDSARVLVVASGGLSHSPPPLLAPGIGPDQPEAWEKVVARARGLVKPEWDEAFLGRLGSADWRSVAAMSNEEVLEAGPGAAEIRSWVAAAFTAGKPVQRVAYEPISTWFTGMGVSATAALASK